MQHLCPLTATVNIVKKRPLFCNSDKICPPSARERDAFLPMLEGPNGSRIQANTPGVIRRATRAGICGRDHFQQGLEAPQRAIRLQAARRWGTHVTHPAQRDDTHTSRWSPCRLPRCLAAASRGRMRGWAVFKTSASPSLACRRPPTAESAQLSEWLACGAPE